MPSISENHFELFDLPMAFALDACLLDERYRALVRGLSASGALLSDDADDGESAALLARVGEAYRVLADPLSRAQYLCGLYAADGGLRSVAAGGHAQGGASLAALLELQESLSAVTNRSDPAGATASALTQLAEQTAALDKELEALFADPTPENLRMARDLVRELTLVWRCRQSAEDRRRVLGIRA